VAIEGIKHARPDGHELIIAANGHTAMNPALYKKLPYDPQKDLVPIAMAYRTPLFIAVAANGPYQSVQALINAAKEKPDAVSYGTPYVGSPAHLGTAEFELATGTKMLHVPFKDQNQAFVSIANGELSWMLSTYASAAPMMKAGRIKLLAVASQKRVKSYPDIPTIEEAGGPPGLELEGWIAFFGPRGIPEDMVRKINADVNQQLHLPDVQERMLAAGWVPSPMTPAQLAELIRKDAKKYAEIVRRTGARID
jgi:tripartite-type tricarboxylate transporter receptor subunit TctC